MFGGAKDDAVRKISEVSQFKQLTKKDAQVLMLNEIEKLITTCQSNEKEVTHFHCLFKLYILLYFIPFVPILY